MPRNKDLLGSYDAANQFLGNKESRNWPSIRDTRIHRTIGGNFRGYGYECEYRANAEPVIAVRYHDTDVVLYYADGRIELNSGGYKTFTTKSRINDFCRAANISIGQTDFKWSVYTPMGVYDFKDHMIILPDGNVEGQPKALYNKSFRYANSWGYITLKIVEIAPARRDLIITLSQEAKRDYKAWRKAHPSTSEHNFLYEVMESVTSNSDWRWLNVTDLGWLVSDLLPVLSNDYHDDPNTGDLISVQWAYYLNDRSWIISGLDDDFKAGSIKFTGIHCQMITNDAANQIRAIFAALADYAALTQN